MRKVMMTHPHRLIVFLLLSCTVLHSASEISVDTLKQEIFKNPYKIEKHEHLIKVLIGQEQYDEAEECIDKALTLFNKPISLLGLRAAVYIQQKKIEKAATTYLELNKRVPNSMTIPYNLGWCLSILHQHDVAITYYLKALSRDPDHGFAHLGISKAYLAVGDYENAWPHFEWRMANFKRYKASTDVSAMRIEDFVGKRVLIRAEWGLGDMMHFVRFAKELKKIGATKIIVQSFEPLVPLFSLCDYIDEVFTKDQASPAFDIQIPMMSLPYVLNTRLETIPTDFPYLKADEHLVEAWRPFFEKDDTIKIGLCWGAKKIFLEEQPYTRRSIPLKMFAALADIPNVTFYSLQKVFDTDQLNDLPDHFKVHYFGPDFDETNGRFMDTAAVMHHLDLIISVDTSVIHLAGNLNKKPIWVLLPYSAAWWWLYERTDTPWYDNMRFYRQPKPNDWHSAFNEVKKSLQQFVEKKQQEKVS